MAGVERRQPPGVDRPSVETGCETAGGPELRVSPSRSTRWFGGLVILSRPKGRIKYRELQKVAAIMTRCLSRCLNLRIVLLLCGLSMNLPVSAQEPQVIGHWPLRGDVQDHSAGKLPTISRAVNLDVSGLANDARGAAGFNGKDSVIEVADSESVRLGTREFSISLRATPMTNWMMCSVTWSAS